MNILYFQQESRSLRFLLNDYWGTSSSGLLLHVAASFDHEISKEHTATIFRVMSKFLALKIMAVRSFEGREEIT